jgi:hypothetical protein
MRRFAFALAPLVLALAPPALAQSPTPRVAVLDLVPRGVPVALGRQATDVARRAVGRNPRYRLAPPPALRLRAMLLALGCAALDAACLAKIARQLEVARVAFGEIGRTATGYLVRVQVYDSARGAVIRTEERSVPEGEGAAGIEQAVEDSIALGLGERLELAVDTNVEGAIVLVNGQPIGTAPITVTEGLRVGTNEVLVRMRGYEDRVLKVSLRPGRPLRVRADLTPLKAVAVAVPPREPEKEVAAVAAPFYKRWWFWTLVGVVVSGATTAAILGTRGEGSPAVGVEF